MDWNTVDAIVKATFAEMDLRQEQYRSYKELYETEKVLREAAEASRDYWHELADDLSQIVDSYVERSQEDPF